MPNGTIEVTFTPAPAAVDDQIRQLLRNVLASSKAAGNSGEFKVDSRSGAFHVVPVARKGMNGGLERYVSPLDVQIDLPCQKESGAEFIERFIRTISAQARRKVTPGTLPINLFVQKRVDVCASQENARDVLWRAAV